MGEADEVGPGFEFDEGDEVGAGVVEEAADGAGEVEGIAVGEDAAGGFGAVGRAVEFAGAGGAGVGRGGEEDEEVGVCGKETFDEVAEREEFPDGDAVKVKAAEGGGGAGGCGGGLGVTSEAGRPVGAIFAGAQRFDREERDEDGRGEEVEDVEEDGHGGNDRRKGEGAKASWSEDTGGGSEVIESTTPRGSFAWSFRL